MGQTSNFMIFYLRGGNMKILRKQTRKVDVFSDEFEMKAIP